MSKYHFAQEEPHYSPDRVAEVNADRAYKAGKWFDWATETNPRIEDNPDARAMLGAYPQTAGTLRYFDERALNDLGFDGTRIYAEEPWLPAKRASFFDTIEPGMSFGKAIQASEEREVKPEDLLLSSLDKKVKHYTHPAVREKARLLSSVPIRVEQDASNVVGYYDGHSFFGDGSEIDVEEIRGRVRSIHMQIPEGKRLVIDNIPKGSKFDNWPYDEENPLTRMQVHIYHNAEGYLVSDKVFTDEEGEPIPVAKKRPISIIAKEGNAIIDDEAEEIPAEDILSSSNDRKKEYINPYDPKDRTIQMLTTTATWKVGEFMYTTREIKTTTKDDASDRVNIDFLNPSGDLFGEEIGPIVFRLVDDSNKTIIDKSYR